MLYVMSEVRLGNDRIKKYPVEAGGSEQTSGVLVNIRNVPNAEKAKC